MKPLDKHNKVLAKSKSKICVRYRAKGQKLLVQLGKAGTSLKVVTFKDVPGLGQRELAGEGGLSVCDSTQQDGF